MAFQATTLVGRTMNLYDSGNGKTLRVKKAVEVSDSCSNLDPGQRVFLLYAPTTRGPLVQVLDTYPHKDFGVTVHWYVRRLKLDDLTIRADILGIKPDELLRLCLLHSHN